MDYVDESDVVMFTVKLMLPCTWEKTDFTSNLHQEEKSVLELVVLQNVSYIWHENKAWN